MTMSAHLRAFAQTNFAIHSTQPAEWIGNDKTVLELLYSLEKAMVVDYDGQDFEHISAMTRRPCRTKRRGPFRVLPAPE